VVHRRQRTARAKKNGGPPRKGNSNIETLVRSRRPVGLGALKDWRPPPNGNELGANRLNLGTEKKPEGYRARHRKRSGTNSQFDKTTEYEGGSAGGGAAKRGGDGNELGGDLGGAGPAGGPGKGGGKLDGTGSNRVVQVERPRMGCCKKKDRGKQRGGVLPRKGTLDLG